VSGTAKAVDRTRDAEIARIGIAHGPGLDAGNAGARAETRQGSPYRFGYGHALRFFPAKTGAEQRSR
jgi:hypothetical protein